MLFITGSFFVHLGKNSAKKTQDFEKTEAVLGQKTQFVGGTPKNSALWDVILYCKIRLFTPNLHFLKNYKRKKSQN